MACRLTQLVPRARTLWLLAAAVPALASLPGCAGLQARQQLFAELSSAAGWHTGIVRTPAFDIAVAMPAPGGKRSAQLTIYLEGDGRAYLDAAQASMDPTPSDPLGLRLALADDTGLAVAYLARPCQYTMPAHGHGCNQAYWTSARYAEPVIEALDLAIDDLKRRAGAVRIVLVGYSGGGGAGSAAGGSAYRCGRPGHRGGQPRPGLLDRARWPGAAERLARPRRASGRSSRHRPAASGR
ncbi:MAG: hypothetical protein ACRYF5_18555 [Janthinobacterium lividum]